MSVKSTKQQRHEEACPNAPAKHAAAPRPSADWCGWYGVQQATLKSTKRARRPAEGVLHRSRECWDKALRGKVLEYALKPQLRQKIRPHCKHMEKG